MNDDRNPPNTTGPWLLPHPPDAPAGTRWATTLAAGGRAQTGLGPPAATRVLEAA